MADHCPECGAPVADGRSCQDNFHALLLLEGEIAGVPGSLLHFYAVATYALQHPDSMNYTAGALAGLRNTLADVLEGRLTPDGLRHRVRSAANGATRVTRRKGEDRVDWPRGNWPVTIAAVCTVDDFGSYDSHQEYADRVTRWAASVVRELDARDLHAS